MGAKQNSGMTHSIQKLIREHAYFPQSFKQLYDPPNQLFVLGHIATLERKLIAVVGNQTPSRLGIENANTYSTQLVESGFCVISGMACGINASAHQAAVKTGLLYSTISVCASGLLHAYPPQFQSLFEHISRVGLLISEYEPNQEAQALFVYQRHRLIASLASAVLVIEASLSSSSLLIAKCAVDLGKDVYAIPGPSNDARYKGCHYLIKHGAKLVESLEDILEELT